MRLVYSCIYTLLLPLTFSRLLFRSIKNSAYRYRWSERLGAIPATGLKSGCIWVHAVSVGETLAAAELIRLMQQKWPDKNLVITTMTPTGSDQVKRLFGDSVFHVYAPYDLACFVNRFLNAVRPEIAIMMETELWPNIIHCCAKKGIPTVVANARLSEKSLQGYQRVSWFSHPMMSEVGCYAVQTQPDADRFKQLGVKASKLTVSGNIKFDLDITEEVRKQRDLILRGIQNNAHRPVFIAASTHLGEDEIILNVFAQLLKRYPALLLILVPRHPERFNDVARLCEDNFKTLKRSASQAVLPDHQVLLVDTMGELLTLFGVADIAFIGGSLVEVGGHNMIEAAAWGVPILTGPHLYNFQEVSELLVNAGGLDICQNEDELFGAASRLLADEGLRVDKGANAQVVVQSNRGALSKLFNVIEQQLL